MKTVPCQNPKNLYKAGTLRSLNLKILSMQDIKLAQKTSAAKFQLSKSYGLGCRRGTNFCQRWRPRRHVTDGNFLLLFSRFMIFIGKKSDALVGRV
jgi:hypothetical protein